MTATLELTMSKGKSGSADGGGDEKKRKKKPGTTHVRLKPDLHEMIREVCEVLKVSNAQYLDPIIRPAVKRRHEELMPTIRKLREARQSGGET